MSSGSLRVRCGPWEARGGGEGKKEEKTKETGFGKGPGGYGVLDLPYGCTGEASCFWVGRGGMGWNQEKRIPP
jgi:hypothetical protein